MENPSEIEYSYTPNAEISMRFRGNVLWRYHFVTDHEKPFIHPLSSPSGVLLTCFEPWDHRWHRGLWFSWHYINDVDYWEERDGVPPGKGEGHLRFVGPELVSINGKRIKVITHYEYVAPDGGVLMEGVRTMRFLPPKNGRYIIDWSVAYHAKSELVLSADQDDSEGYTGLSLRMARSLGNFQRLNSEGKRDEETLNAMARWVDITGVSDGGWDLQAGVTVMEHPENIRTPNLWKTSGLNHFGFINPSPVLEAPLRLSVGDGVPLRYRVLVHDGVLEHAQLAEEFAAYAAITH